jgi:hypothetical protein
MRRNPPVFIVNPVFRKGPQQRPSFSPEQPRHRDRRQAEEIEEFTRRFVEACRSMDHKAAIEMWADDGVDLPSELEPMIGKEAISPWLGGLDAQMKRRRSGRTGAAFLSTLATRVHGRSNIAAQKKPSAQCGRRVKRMRRRDLIRGYERIRRARLAPTELRALSLTRTS